MEQNFEIKKLFETLKCNYPSLVVEHYHVNENHPERGAFRGYYLHPTIPSLALSVSFFNRLSSSPVQRVTENNECVKEYVDTISIESSFELKADKAQIGDYDRIRETFREFLLYLGFDDWLEDPHITVKHLSGDYLPSLETLSYDAWEPTLQALEFWKEITEGNTVSSASVLGDLIGTEHVQPLEEFNLLEFANMLQEKFPGIKLGEDGFVNEENVCRLSVCYPHPTVPSCALSVVFAGEKNEVVLVKNSTLSLKVDRNKLLKSLTENSSPIAEISINFVHRLKTAYPERSDWDTLRISSEITFPNDWDEVVNVMQLWKDTVTNVTD